MMPPLPEPWREDADGEPHYTIVQVIEHGQACRAAALEEAANAIRLLDLMFFKYEEGVQCYEEPDDCTGFLGHAFRLDDDEFNEIVQVLNKLSPRKKDKA